MVDLFQEENRIVSVLVPYPVDKAYDYALPDDLVVSDGDYVVVPLGQREVIGVVWGKSAGDVSPKKIKRVLSRYAMRHMPEVMRNYIDWVADYTMSPRGMVLKMCLSAPDALKPPKAVTLYDLAAGVSYDDVLNKLTPKQQPVLETVHAEGAMRAADVASKADCSAGVVKTLVKKGVLTAVESVEPPPCLSPDPDFGAFDLSQDQQEAANVLKGLNGFSPALLDGVTGAGKTEVYFEAVESALRRGEQVLLLLPEIALSNAFLERFRRRFGCDPALWHSGLTKAERARTWRGVAQGKTRVVVGARSALFMPYSKLGLVIVDEEHDPAYKQEDGVLYHARDMAIVRARMSDCPIILVSATPSLETMNNVWQGRYQHVSLPARFGGARMPQIHLIDMRVDKPERQHFIAPSLMEVVKATLEQGKQAMLFLNRRGYAPLTLCRKCGHRLECPRCTAWLVEHKSYNQLQCHHCGFHVRSPDECPECHEKDSLAACGPGVERIHDEVKVAFPDARSMVLASDTAESQDELRDMLSQIREGDIDIVIGTQIIAKGHHFPHLTCVGVIDADLGLNGGELRASERVYQLLHQVAGRAGREADQGHVYLQTFMPEHRIMQALSKGGRDEFLKTESAERELVRMPPFARLAGIIVQGKDEQQVIDVAKELGRTAPHNEHVQTLGPAPAPYARLRGNFRYRLLVRADKHIHIQKTLNHWLEGIKKPSTVRIITDIDPQSFF